MQTAIYGNKLKTGLIVSVIFAFFALIIYFVSVSMGMDYTGAATISIGFSLLCSLGSYWFSDKMVIKMSGARKPDPEQEAQLRPIVERLCREADLPVPTIYVSDEAAPNAFATGRNKNHAAVCVTVGLLNALDKRQLEGVIAHELAHIKNYDILLQTVAAVMIGAAMMLANIWSRSLFYRSSRRSDRENSGNALFLIIGLIATILAPIAGQLMKMALSRNREYLADATGASFTGNPEGLASALLKINEYSIPCKRATEATEGLYIINPLKASLAGKNIRTLFSTHPSVEERVERLRNLR